MVILLYIRYGNFNGITGDNDLETMPPDLPLHSLTLEGDDLCFEMWLYDPCIIRHIQFSTVFPKPYTHPPTHTGI
jgi:hypothetical protein